jgi:hypothetical protein
MKICWKILNLVKIGKKCQHLTWRPKNILLSLTTLHHCKSVLFEQNGIRMLRIPRMNIQYSYAPQCYIIYTLLSCLEWISMTMQIYNNTGQLLCFVGRAVVICHKRTTITKTLLMNDDTLSSLLLPPSSLLSQQQHVFKVIHACALINHSHNKTNICTNDKILLFLHNLLSFRHVSIYLDHRQRVTEYQ